MTVSRCINNIYGQNRKEIADLAHILFLDFKDEEKMFVIFSVLVGIISRWAHLQRNCPLETLTIILSWTMLSEDQNNPMRNPCQIGHSGYDLFLCTMLIGNMWFRIEKLWFEIDLFQKWTVCNIPWENKQESNRISDSEEDILLMIIPETYTYDINHSMRNRLIICNSSKS